MAITATTLSGAVAVSDAAISVASATGITAPTPQTGVGITYLKVDNEMMLALSVVGTLVNVARGQLGTQQVAHVASTPVLFGAPADFPNFVAVTPNVQPHLPYSYSPVGAPLTGATIAPLNGYIHHFTGSTALVTITVPSGLVSGGKITLVMDGTGSGLQWTAAGNIAVAGTAGTAASSVDFFYDPASAKWIPSRLA